MTKICPNCKTENLDNAGFCQNCGNKLATVKTNPNTSTKSGSGVTEWWNKQSKGGKTAIGIVGVCCIGLILIVAIGGMFSPDKNTATTSNSSNPTTTVTPAAPAAPSWHSIANFTGTGDKNTPSFTTKGNKFKVVLSASASSPEYAVLSFFAYPEGETKSYVGQGDISSFSQSKESDEFEVTASPGNYYLSVIAANLNNWHAQIFDYY
jgi:hypothetical protein